MLIRIKSDMIKSREVPLKIELFSDGEDNEFRVRTDREIRSILNGIAQDGARAALYYGEGNNFLLTTVLKVNEQGIWLDVGSIETDNQRVLRSNKIIFISSRHQVKIQFVANRIENVLLENRAAFFLHLPDSLLRIQRREYFRLTAPVSNPLKCIIPVFPPITLVEPDTHIARREVTIMDISGGGIALVCEAHDTELQPGAIYEDCRISLPDIGTISVTVKVKNSFEVTLRNGQISKRAGCEFVHLGGEASTLLQRYVVQLQSETLVKT